MIAAMAAGGVLAASFIAQGVRAHLEARHADGRPAAICPSPAPVPWDANGSDGPVGAPLSAMGLRPVAADPGDVAPPAGASRRQAFRRRLTDGVETQAWYDWWGPAERAAEHYREALARKGFKLLSDRPGADGRRTLVFAEANTYATVALRTSLPREQLVIIVFTIASPTPTGGKNPR